MALLMLVFLAMSSLVLANGKITHLSGSVTLQHANGQQEPALPGTEVKESDTLVTGKDGFARMETTDGGEMVFRPNSEFHIDKYSYNKDKPAEDSFVYSMLKGGLRTVTGLIGKRGNKDAYQGNTPTSTIGIRGTFFEVRVCGDCGSLPKGTYLAVRSGSVQTGNSVGSLTMTAGQIVFVPPGGAPQLLPNDPGIGFTAPAAIPKQGEHHDDTNNNDNNQGNGGDGGVNCQIQ